MKNYLKIEYMPARKTFWVLFDMSNGSKPAKRYVWWFDTREDARKFLRHHRTMKHGVRLSTPVKVVMGNY